MGELDFEAYMKRSRERKKQTNEFKIAQQLLSKFLKAGKQYLTPESDGMLKLSNESGKLDLANPEQLTEAASEIMDKYDAGYAERDFFYPEELNIIRES